METKIGGKLKTLNPNFLQRCKGSSCCFAKRDKNWKVHYNNTHHNVSINSISNTFWWCFDDRQQRGQSDWAPTRGHHGGRCVDIVFPVPQLTTVFNNVLTMNLPTYLSWNLVGEEGSRRVSQLGMHHNGVITDMSLTSPPVINIKNWHNLNLQESLCYDSYQIFELFFSLWNEMTWVFFPAL